MQLTGIRQKVFLDRYSVKNEAGEPVEQTPEEMWVRIAHAAAQVEDGRTRKKWEKLFYDAMEGFKYVPGGRILAGAGTGYSVTFYNCFVIPSPKDSRGGILETLSQMVEIMAHGGGVGINLSSLRAKGARVQKVNGFSSGPCNWAELFSLATKDIIQQGGTRRGALMLMLWDWHPDIEEFITVKQDLSRINGANLSLCISDSFMEAVKRDGDWELLSPDRQDPDYDELWDGDMTVWKARGKKVIVQKVVKAREIWDKIAQAAWRSAEPGVVFMERYNKWHNNYYWNRINCVNPCGEEGLPEWGVCNLGSINLSVFAKSKTIDEPAVFDFEKLKETVCIATRFQDNVIDMDPYIFDGIRKTQLEGERRIGLGTMGLGDALIKMHLRYGSAESLPIIEKIYKTIRDEAYRESAALGREKGVFARFDAEKFSKGLFIRELPKDLQKEIKKSGIRNSVILMQAPTGTTSLLANTTSGIEPVYEFEFIRHSRLGRDILRHHLYEEWFENHKEEVQAGTLKRPGWFVSANDLIPEDHVYVQAVVQKYVDASISKTVNAPNSHTVEDVKKLYSMAYEYGLKGITYMRDGSRVGVLERPEEKKVEEAPKAEVHVVKPRPMFVQGATYKMNTPVGKAYITVNSNGDGQPFEVFINVGKAGSDAMAMAEGLGRMISYTLRIPSHLSTKEKVQIIIKELSNIGGSSAVGFGKDRVRSLPDAVAKVLTMHALQKEKTMTEAIHEEPSATNGNGNNTAHANGNGNGNGNGHAATVTYETTIEETVVIEESASAAQSIQLEAQSGKHFDICPDCGVASLVYEEGCKKCYSCGYSAC